MSSFGTSAMIVNTTIQNHLKGATPAILRKRYLLAKLLGLKRIKLNCSGKQIDWSIRHKRTAMTTIGEGGTVVFAKESKYKKGTLPWRAYYVQGTISAFDKEMNKGPEAKVNLWANKVEERMDDFKDGFPEKIYGQDGYASGSGEIMGFPSAFGASASATSIFGTNSDTYAGLSTVLGTYGGTASVSPFWPFGTASTQYDFHTPVVVNYTSPCAAGSGGFESDTKTWPNTCAQALRAGIMAAMRNGSTLNAITMEMNLYRQFLDAVSADQRLTVNRNEDPAITKLGFKAVNFDGVDIVWEVGIPAGIAYGHPFEDYELLSLSSQLIKSMEDFNLESLSDRVVLTFFGNLKFRKLNGMVQWKNLS